jgi:pimeloyl-ACP methyl ester carboxylesterase
MVCALAEIRPERKYRGIFPITAPFVDVGGWPNDSIPARLDLGAALPRDVPVFLYQGDADPTVPASHVDLSMPERYQRRMSDTSPVAIIR